MRKAAGESPIAVMGKMQDCPSQGHEDRQSISTRPLASSGPTSGLVWADVLWLQDRQSPGAFPIASAFWLAAHICLCYNGALGTRTLPTTKYEVCEER